MIKRPDNWNTLIDSFDDCNCPYAYIVGYYLSRFDRNAYKKLGFGNMTETHKKIGSVLEISSNTIKNFLKEVGMRSLFWGVRSGIAFVREFEVLFAVPILLKNYLQNRYI